jgi:bacteriocin biosynthesis cyclodehydratase domain-containing protein
MVLKVREGVPLVWRSPSSLQFGVDEPLIVLEDVDEGTERLVAALVGGISSTGFDMMARSAGVSPDAAAELLARLEPVLAPETSNAVAPSARVAVSGDGPLADELRRVLRAEGVLADSSADSDESSPDLAVIVAGWVVSPEDHGRWLRRDIPHLPVVVGDGGVTIGPLVEPGDGPCLYCVQLARTDDDAAWPAIATQLWNRPAPPLTSLAVAEAAAFVARRVLEHVGGGRGTATSWRLRVDGEVSSHVWTRHAQCRCAAPAESDWPLAADPENRSATTRAAAVAVPA